MAQASPDTSLPRLFQNAQRSVRRARDAGREASRDLARLRDELARRGIDVEVTETTGSEGPQE